MVTNSLGERRQAPSDKDGPWKVTPSNCSASTARSPSSPGRQGHRCGHAHSPSPMPARTWPWSRAPRATSGRWRRESRPGVAGRWCTLWTLITSTSSLTSLGGSPIDLGTSTSWSTTPAARALYPVLETTPEHLEQSFHFNVAAPFELSRLAIPRLLERPGASIINISSMAGRNAPRRPDRPRNNQGGPLPADPAAGCRPRPEDPGQRRPPGGGRDRVPRQLALVDVPGHPRHDDRAHGHAP